MKPEVFYSDIVRCKVGEGATVFLAEDHPNGNVSDGEMAYTSTVVSYNESTGVFETKNTIYKPKALEMKPSMSMFATKEDYDANR